ncbi:hypothetical protein Rsub_08829 [Raphidocelis subcapitata]|uniref:Transglutaminase-like domain-containing protein n=1 Tax=Raphidocelis subcapitata TaxID=307507 RepID=A0A2V0P809_9CHLO|nr:hypothetical protein Rsub_08829 [Raphidocelis subcapitata]|eukprot:GBF96014.1 hypothetical protein Rsub_08829 [Raphidocelis subcapitata]
MAATAPADMAEWLAPTRLIDSDHPKVVERAHDIIDGAGDEVQRALLIYFFVRDAIKFGVPVKLDMLKASEVLALGYACATPKTTLFVALLRAVGIPARMHMVSINMAVNAGFGMPANVYGDHAYAEVFLHGCWFKLDSYAVDAPLFAAARARLKALGWRQGYGIHRRGINEWDGMSDSFCQYLVRGTETTPRGPRDVLRIEGPLKHAATAGVTRDSPQSDADFGVVKDMEDFKTRVVGSPFAKLRAPQFRLPFFFSSAVCNMRIAAVRAGKN